MIVTQQSRLTTSALLPYYNNIKENRKKYYLGKTIIQLLDGFAALELQCYYKF